MNEYVSVEELKYTLEISGSRVDGNLALVAEAASRDVDDHCGRRFYTTVAAEQRYFTPDRWSRDMRYVDGDPVGAYGHTYLDVGDLNSVTSVGVDTNDDGTFEQAWTVDVDYRMEPYNNPLDGKPWDRLVLTSSGGRSMPGYDHSIRIVGKWGWTTVPPAVKLATSMLATRYLKRQREAPFAVLGIGVDGVGVRVPSLDPDVERLLRPFSLHQVLV